MCSENSSIPCKSLISVRFRIHMCTNSQNLDYCYEKGYPSVETWTLFLELRRIKKEEKRMESFVDLMEIFSYRSDAVDFGEVGFGVAQAASGDVHEMVALAFQARAVAALVPALRGRIHSDGAILLHVLHPLVQVEAQQVAAYEVAQPPTHHSQRPHLRTPRRRIPNRDASRRP
jgi:hypothetical protein